MNPLTWIKKKWFSFSLIINKREKEVNWYSVNFLLCVCVEAKAAPELCFKDVNSKGDRFGNCGYHSNGFKKCESRYSTTRYTAFQFNYNSSFCPTPIRTHTLSFPQERHVREAAVRERSVLSHIWHQAVNHPDPHRWHYLLGCGLPPGLWRAWSRHGQWGHQVWRK